MTTLASVWEDDDSMISETFVQHSNNFYDEYPANAKLIFTIKVTQDTDAADSTTPEDPTAPNTHAINWLIQEGEEAILANFAFALNWKQTGAMTHPEEVKVATDGTAEIVMDWDTLVKKAGTGNIFEWSYAVSDGTVPAGQKMELVSVKFVGEEGTTTTTPSTDADADADADADTDTEEDDIPKSGSAPVALALIPVALAAAVVIAKKKA